MTNAEIATQTWFVRVVGATGILLQDYYTGTVEGFAAEFGIPATANPDRAVGELTASWQGGQIETLEWELQS